MSRRKSEPVCGEGKQAGWEQDGCLVSEKSEIRSLPFHVPFPDRRSSHSHSHSHSLLPPPFEIQLGAYSELHNGEPLAIEILRFGV